MKSRSPTIAVLVLLMGSTEAFANDPDTPIATDRPSATASSVVVPLGALQVENGTADTTAQGQHTLDGPETSFRFGMWSETELRFTAPNLIEQGAGGSGFGAADLVLGLKQQILRGARAFDVSVIVSLSLPTGSNAVSSHGYDASVQLPWSRQISPNWTATGMLSVYTPTQNGRHNVTGETTFLLDRQWTTRVDGFIEYVGAFPQLGGTRHLAHAGMALKVTAGQQLDAHVGVGLSSAAPDYLVGVGYSFRVQTIRRRP